MLESVNTDDKLVFADLSEEEKKKRGILGRLYGPCADVIQPTRNGRKYSDKLWEKVFQQPLVEEMFNVGGIPGEIDHPADRSETDSTRIAIMLHEKPKRGKDGKLMAYFDILDTPCGKIAYQLAKYGFKWGVSSRGEGDIIEDYSTGEEVVDPSSYTLNAFDLVLVPSVEKARLSLISEGLGTKEGRALKLSLKESLDSANATDREIMEGTLRDLNIDFEDKTLNESVSTHESVANNGGSATTADNDGVDEAIKSLQEALKKSHSLQSQVKELQDKLSACNAREAKLKESLQRSGSESKSLQERLDATERELDGVKSKLARISKKLEESKKLTESQQRRIDLLQKRCDSKSTNQKSLNESLSERDDKIEKLQEQLSKERATSEEQVSSLKESLSEAEQNLAIKDRELKMKVSKAKKLAEGYQKLANDAIDKYIEVRARGIGVTPAEMKRKLGESYSLDDVDRVCEDLGNAQLTMSELPFELRKPKKVKMTESKKDPLLPTSGADDDVDGQLIYLAGSYMGNI